MEHINLKIERKFHHDILQQWDSVKGIRKYYHQLLPYIHDNKTILYCLYICGHGDFMERSLPLAFQDLTPCMKAYPAVSGKDWMCVRIFNIYGCNGLIKNWLLNDCKEPDSEMAELLFQYTMRILSISEDWKRHP